MNNDHAITGELREWAKKLTHWWYDPVKDVYTYTTGTMPPSIDAIRLDSNITAIADRIDAAHEQAMAAAALIAGVPMTDEHMAEHGWYRALDRDKVPIRIGDKADSDHYEDGTVTGVQFCETANGGIRTLVAVRPDGWDVPTWHVPDEYRHQKPPTVEDVLKEFAFDVLPATCMADHEVTDAIERFAPMLQLRGDAE